MAVILGTDSVRRSTSAAKVTAIMLGCNAAVHVVWVSFWLVVASRLSGGTLPVEFATSARSVNETLTALSWLLEIGAAVAFFVWVSRTFRTARALGVPPLRYDASSIIAGFFIPFVNFVRPYQGLRALDAAIEPTSLPEPPPTPATTDDGGGYRQAARAKGPESGDSRRPPLLAWWVVWVSQGVLGIAAMAVADAWEGATYTGILLSSALASSATLALVVVLRIDSRLRERARRTVEVL